MKKRTLTNVFFELVVLSLLDLFALFLMSGLFFLEGFFYVLGFLLAVLMVAFNVFFVGEIFKKEPFFGTFFEKVN